MKHLLSITVSLVIGTALLNAEPVEADLQSRIDAKVKVISTWAANPVIVNAVKEQNANPPADLGTLTQEKWKGLSVLDPTVRGFMKTPAAEFLKAQRSDSSVSEAFLSAADGTKVAFITKPSNWSHKGKAKHDEPMQGKVWQGAVEVDESTGVKQVQVAVPVLDGGKPIGSLIVGLNIAKLAEK